MTKLWRFASKEDRTAVCVFFISARGRAGSGVKEPTRHRQSTGVFRVPCWAKVCLVPSSPAVGRAPEGHVGQEVSSSVSILLYILYGIIQQRCCFSLAVSNGMGALPVLAPWSSLDFAFIHCPLSEIAHTFSRSVSVTAPVCQHMWTAISGSAWLYTDFLVTECFLRGERLELRLTPNFPATLTASLLLGCCSRKPSRFPSWQLPRSLTFGPRLFRTCDGRILLAGAAGGRHHRNPVGHDDG